MAANFEQWFNDKYGKNQSYGRGVALEAWNAAKAAEALKPSHNKQSTPCKHGLSHCSFDVCFKRCDTCVVTKV